MQCPIFREGDTTKLINYSGSLVFEKSKSVTDGKTEISYHPSGNFSIAAKGGTTDLLNKKKFYVDWLREQSFS